jgi:hypothetical protein
MAETVFLPETEEAYTAWVRQHPHGHVINALKGTTQTATPMIWHRADCFHIEPADSVRYVTGEFIKACALNPAVLAVWAKPRPEALNYCMDCESVWSKEAQPRGS